MKIAIMQPYFMPYIGYWQLLQAADTFIVYDDVNFIKGGWINRNNILVQNRKFMFSLQLEKAGSYRKINEIQIKDDFSHFLKTLQMNYSKAPYFTTTMALIQRICSFPNRNLANFLFNSIQTVCDYLSINCVILKSSEMEKDSSLTGKFKVLDICRRMKADVYINAIGGQELYNKEDFATQGIDLRFVKTQMEPYKQFNNEFIGNLSLIDVLMFNSIQETQHILTRYLLF